MTKHAFITKNVENIGRFFSQLVELVGSEGAAMELLMANQDVQEARRRCHITTDGR